MPRRCRPRRPRVPWTCPPSSQSRNNNNTNTIYKKNSGCANCPGGGAPDDLACPGRVPRALTPTFFRARAEVCAICSLRNRAAALATPPSRTNKSPLRTALDIADPGRVGPWPVPTAHEGNSTNAEADAGMSSCTCTRPGSCHGCHYVSARELQSAQSGPAPALSRGRPGHTAIAEEGLNPLRTGSVLATGVLTAMNYAYDLTDFLD